MNHRPITTRTIIFSGLGVIIILAGLWWYVCSYYQQRQAGVFENWSVVQSQVTENAARSIQSWLTARVETGEVLNDELKQEAFDLFVAPLQLLDNGLGWVFINSQPQFARDGTLTGDLSDRGLIEGFEQQASLGAQNYHDLIRGIVSGTSGKTRYIWLPDRGEEFAAWTTIDIFDEQWTIGLSVPSREIIEFSNLAQEQSRIFASTAISTALLLLLYIMMLNQRRQAVHQLRVLERSVAERTQDLVRSETRYRTLVENLREGILMYDPAEERVLYSNPAAAAIFGKNRKNDTTQPLDILKQLTAEDSLRLTAILKRQLVDPTPSTGIYQGHTVNGAPLWLEVRSTRMDFEGRTVNALLVYNFTERKRTEAALRESEERYRGIFNGVQDAILLADIDGRVLDVNASACEMYGYSREEFLLKSVPDFCPPEYSINLQEVDLDSPEVKHPIEAIHIRQDGVRFPVEVTFRAQVLNGFRVTLITVRDITRRKEAEAEVEETRRKINQMMASVPDALWNGEVIDDERVRIDYVSPVFEKITGLSIDKIMDNPRRWAQMIHPDDRDRYLSETGTFYSTRIQSLELEYRITRPDSSIRYVRDLQYQHLSPKGVMQIDGVLADVTEQKHVDHQIKRANRDLSLTVKELQIRHREVSLLNEMGDLLQSCLTVEDAYTVITRFSQQLFPNQSGALYIIEPAAARSVMAAHWGEKPPSQTSISPQECWGLRRNRLHVFSEPGVGLRCSHVARTNNPAYICAPLHAQGETIGMLHVLCDHHPIQERSVQLAETMARQVALALTNLRLRAILRIQATQDALTGLFNRRYMEDTLAELVRGRSTEASLGIILLDIDRFKHCNDTFGHEAGDTLLATFGQYLQSLFTHNSVACRYGGDEFVVVLPDASLTETLRQAERLRAGFRQQKVYYQGEQLKFNTLSLGVAGYPDHGVSLSALMRQADAALYRAKTAGGDQVVVATQN